MPSPMLKNYLESHHVPYRSIPHRITYTAQETAEEAHIPGQQVAKIVVLRVEGQLCLAVLPATAHVRLSKLRQELGTEDVALAREDEFADAFPDCEVGAAPPFGNLYHMKVFVSPKLREDEEIAFNGGTHDELIQMSYSDFERLAAPNIVRF